MIEIMSYLKMSLFISVIVVVVMNGFSDKLGKKLIVVPVVCGILALVNAVSCFFTYTIIFTRILFGSSYVIIYAGSLIGCIPLLISIVLYMKKKNDIHTNNEFLRMRIKDL